MCSRSAQSDGGDRAAVCLGLPVWPGRHSPCPWGPSIQRTMSPHRYDRNRRPFPARAANTEAGGRPPRLPAWAQRTSPGPGLGAHPPSCELPAPTAAGGSAGPRTERHRPCSTRRRPRARLTRSLRLCSPFHAPSGTSHFSIQPSGTSCSGVSLRPPCPGSPILPWALGTTCLKECQARPTPLGLVSPRGGPRARWDQLPDPSFSCAPLWCWADFTWGRPKEGPQQTG